MKNNIVVISIPFQRLEKNYLSRFFIDPILETSDILIVSPFCSDIYFFKKYNFDGIAQLNYSSSSHSGLKKLLIKITKVLRMHGYWRKNKNSLPYYFFNRNKQYGDNGIDIKFLGLMKFFINIIGIVGFAEISWNIFNKLIPVDGNLKNKIEEIIGEYSKASIIVTSSWSEQDRELLKIAKHLKLRKILIPYTTDQLLCNGYLLEKFDVICIKGKEERRYAINFHNISPDKLVDIGYLNFRLIDKRLSQISNNKKNDLAIVMLAGSISKYYPANDEIYVLDSLLKNIPHMGFVKNVKIVYRTFLDDSVKVNYVKDAVAKYNNLEVQIVSNVSAGMESYCPDEFFDEDKYLSDIFNSDLIISLASTSLSLEAAYLGVPTISCWAVNSVFFEDRGWKLLFENQDKLKNVYRYFPNVFNIYMLLSITEKILTSDFPVEQIVSKTVADWDMNGVDYQSQLSKIVHEI